MYAEGRLGESTEALRAISACGMILSCDGKDSGVGGAGAEWDSSGDDGTTGSEDCAGSTQSGIVSLISCRRDFGILYDVSSLKSAIGRSFPAFMDAAIHETLRTGIPRSGNLRARRFVQAGIVLGSITLTWSGVDHLADRKRRPLFDFLILPLSGLLAFPCEVLKDYV